MKKFVNGGGGQKPYKIRESKYIILIFLMILGFSSIYFSSSYGLFKKKQDLTRIDFIAGTLNYDIKSDKLTNNKITVNKNETVSFDIEITSLNKIDSKYELYYLINGEKQENENIIVGYSSSTENEVSGIIKVNETKNISVNINNKTDEEIEITFGVEGGLINNELTMSKGNQLALFNTCEYEPGYIWEFDYNGTNGSDGSTQEFAAPCDGIYKLETWGAQGGSVNLYPGGYGAYSTGTISLKKDTILHLNIGGKGLSKQIIGASTDTLQGGFNGGGSAHGSWTQDISSSISQYFSSGGGATSVALVKGTISEIGYDSFVTQGKGLIIASGGSGATYFKYNGSETICTDGSGGGIKGNQASCNSSGSGSYVTATQTNPATAILSSSTVNTGEFGKSGLGYYVGGGGGLFSGAGAYYLNGGGSSYIGNPLLTNKSMYCYNCTTSNEESTNTVSTDCHNQTSIPTCAKEGNGYARITYVGKKYNQYKTYIFDYNGTNGSDGLIQEFVVPSDGTYKLETWGAQGGSVNLYPGGYGAYSTGTISLKKDMILHLNIGGKGLSKQIIGASTDTLQGGFNGGGSAHGSWTQDISSNISQYFSSGGGATSVALVKGTIFEIGYDSFVTQGKGLIIASGGSGATYFKYNGSETICTDGSGGGIKGNQASCNSSGSGSYVTATQTNPATAIYSSSTVNIGEFGKSGLGYYVGGGGGLFSGAGAYYLSGGGSSYIGNPLLTNKSMYCYNCTTSNEESTKTISTDCHSLNPTTNCAKEGNGYARITYLGD